MKTSWLVFFSMCFCVAGYINVVFTTRKYIIDISPTYYQCDCFNEREYFFLYFNKITENGKLFIWLFGKLVKDKFRMLFHFETSILGLIRGLPACPDALTDI